MSVFHVIRHGGCGVDCPSCGYNTGETKYCPKCGYMGYPFSGEFDPLYGGVQVGAIES